MKKLIIISIFSLFIFSCDTSPQEKIIGVWEGFNGTYIFNNDKTCVVTKKDFLSREVEETKLGNWKINGDRLIISYGSDIVIIKYEIISDNLVFKFVNNEKSIDMYSKQ